MAAAHLGDWTEFIAAFSVFLLSHAIPARPAVRAGLIARLGERWFLRHLVDGDPASNNGGWQWSASTGTDAQPYFRIFNPINQSEKFDAEGKFIRRYVPALAGLNNKDIHAPWLAKPLALQAAGITLGKTYPEPIVDHAQARETTLARYAVVKKAA